MWRPELTRRALLGAALLVPLAGCATKAASPTEQSSTTTKVEDHFVELERRFAAQVGVYALDTGTGATVAYRADERFAFCSTFKTLAAAATLRANSLAEIDALIRYTSEDLLSYAPITKEHVASGMTIRELCDAAIRYSDNTAANLLLGRLGGPEQVTAYTRSLGDTVTRMDRVEPDLNTAIPGDLRDTTSPRAFATDYQRLVLGDALPADKRALLAGWLENNTTGAKQIRAGVPQGWKVADKTGSGDYGTANDIGIVGPPTGAPLVMAIMTTHADKNAQADHALIAQVSTRVVSALT